VAPQRDDDELDLEDRELCPDGSCIGVIGDDGRCGECGRAGERAPRPAGSGGNGAPEKAKPDKGGGKSKADKNKSGGVPKIIDVSSEKSEKSGAGPGKDPGKDKAGKAGSHDEWSERQLCSDGGCIGVIGANGRCNECGKAPE
jgi:hypothetical protein